MSHTRSHLRLAATALLGLVALLGPSVSSARRIPPRPRPPRVTVAVSVSVDAKLRATVTITNTAHSTITLRSHVKTHELHYDWLTISLRYPTGTAKDCADGHAGIAVRNLTFTDNRDKSYNVDVQLAPGKSVTHKINLKKWAKRRVNGGKIGPGYYKVYAVYDSSGERGEFTGRAISPEVELEVPGKLRGGKGTMCKSKPARW